MLASLDKTVESTNVGRYTISTVFVGINSPLLFETAIFDNWGKEKAAIHAAYATWEQAKSGHQQVVKYVHSDLVPF